MNSESQVVKHSHRCQGCGMIWAHGDKLAGDIEAHKCPGCGKSEWRKYSGTQQRSGKVLQMPSHGGGSYSFTRVITGLVLIVVAGCLFAHVIIGLVDGDL